MGGQGKLKVRGTKPLFPRVQNSILYESLTTELAVDAEDINTPKKRCAVVLAYIFFCITQITFLPKYIIASTNV